MSTVVITLYVYISELDDPTKYNIHVSTFYSNYGERYSFTRFSEASGDFTLQLQAYQYTRDLKRIVHSSTLCSVDLNTAVPLKASKWLDVIDDFSAYSWSIRRISENNTNLFTVYRTNEEQELEEVFQYEYQRNILPHIAAFVCPQVSTDEPLGADEHSNTTLILRMQSRTIARKAAASSWKSLYLSNLHVLSLAQYYWPARSRKVRSRRPCVHRFGCVYIQDFGHY